MNRYSPSDRIELEDLREMDALLKKLEDYRVSKDVNNIWWASLSTLSGEKIDGDQFVRDRARNFLEKIVKERHHAEMHNAKEPDYRITKEGIKFLADGKTYVGEFKQALRTQKREAFYNKVDKINRILTPILGILTLILTATTVYFAYVSIQQNKDIDQLNKDRDELKAKIERLEKADTKQQIESKLKLPIKK